jgi:peptidase E
MKRLLMFSSPTETVKRQILPLLFPQEIQQEVFAFMPSEGLQGNEKYVVMSSEWQSLAEQHHAEFVLIDNASERIEEERAKLRRANIVFITGGNTCVLLSNLRRSGLDQDIVELTRRNEYVLAGYSAGAMILTPTIEY